MEINVISVCIIILHKIKKMGFNVNIVVILSRIALNVKFRIGAINVILFSQMNKLLMVSVGDMRTRMLK